METKRSKLILAGAALLGVLFVLWYGFGRQVAPLAEIYPGDLTRVDRIVFMSGASGNTRVLTDKDQIAAFIDKVKDIPFPLQFSQVLRNGYGYSITFYEHGERKFGFSTENVKGKYYNIKPDMLKAIKEWAPPML